MSRKSTYEIVKGKGKTMWCVVGEDGPMRFYSKRERQARVEKVKAYLAQRALRAAEAAKQGRLF